MHRPLTSLTRRPVGAVAVALAAVALCAGAAAQTAPRSYEASPEVYKVVADSNGYLVIEVTWKPGQRDALHSHAPVSAVYYLDSCRLRFHRADGTPDRDVTPPRGYTTVQGAVPLHTVENIGTADCRLIMFEPK